MIDYKIVIKDLSGNALAEIDRYKSLRYQHVLNREGDCSFGVSINDEKLTGNLMQLGQREVYIYRGSDIVWGGVLLNEQGGITGKDDVVTFRAKGFFWYFTKRLIVGTQ